MGLWGSRFNEPTDEQLRKLNDSIPYDIRLAEVDIRGSMAYARSLGKVGILTNDEVETLLRGLHAILAEFANNQFELRDGDEDIHTAVERRLSELVGPVGGKLHTGRSRNDQVATDFRLWCMQANVHLRELVRQLQSAVLTQAEAHVHTILPGYTHLQPAQPVTVAHWLMSFFWMLTRDQERLMQIHQRIAILPLGSGALAGTPLDIDRTLLAEELGFSQVSQNSLDAVSDRDFVVELLFATSLMALHLSRLAEDVVLYSNPSFGFIILHDRYSTGSSLMPQKRNADPMELTRAKAGRLIGNLNRLLVILKGLPSGYNKDLQEDKEAFFDTYDTLITLLPVVTAIIHSMKFSEDSMRAALSEDMLATDLADYLVRRGLPFRQAHHAVGQLVRLASERHIQLSQIPLEEYQLVSALFEEDVYAVFDFTTSVSKRRAPGGTAPDAVREQLKQAHHWLYNSQLL